MVGENRNNRRKICSSATLHTTTNLTFSGLRSNPEFRGYGLAYNCLSHDTAQEEVQLMIFFNVIPCHLSEWLDQNNIT